MIKVELEMSEEVLQSARRSEAAHHFTQEQWIVNLPR